MILTTGFYFIFFLLRKNLVGSSGFKIWQTRKLETKLAWEKSVVVTPS